MTPLSARVVLDLAQRSARGRRGTLRFEGSGMPAARSQVSGSGDPDATITVHDQRAWPAILRRGSRGLAESYIAGWWDTDDLTAVVRVALRRTTELRRIPRHDGAPFRRARGGGAATPAAEQAPGP